MMRILFVLAAFATVGLLHAQEPGQRDYTAGAAQAVRDGRPLVVFLGCAPRSIAGPVTCQTDALPGYDAPAVVVSVPGGDWLHWRATLPANATDAQIAAALQPRRAVQPAAVPFSLQSAGRDVDLPAEVSAIIAGMERYSPAKFTQRVFNGNQIEAVSRKALEPHWQVPAGMVGLTGWRSELFRLPNMRAKVQRSPIELWNGGYWSYAGGGTVYENGLPKKSYQPEQAFLREYPDGARFVDLRSTDKGIFEVFVREKVAGKWFSFVDYENHDARPVGYTGLTQTCGSCHAQAGSGGYAVGWVPGGDGVLSDPIPELELMGSR